MTFDVRISDFSLVVSEECLNLPQLILIAMKVFRYIFCISIIGLLCAAPSQMNAAVTEAMPEISEQANLSEVKITVSNTSENQEVRVRDAEGLKLEVYNVLGVRVAIYRIDSNDKTFTLSFPRGCYLLKVDKVVRKTFIH